MTKPQLSGTAESPSGSGLNVLTVFKGLLTALKAKVPFSVLLDVIFKRLEVSQMLVNLSTEKLHRTIKRPHIAFSNKC